jgi:hypothetical protein
MHNSLLTRVCRKYRQGGLAAIALSLVDRIKRPVEQHTPAVSWAHFYPINELAARTLTTEQPPLLVLSLPRSGSSWVGETLGTASNALYLREPITQTYLAKVRQTGGEMKVNFEVDSSKLPTVYIDAADSAFLAIPRLPRSIVKYPHQWGLLSRRGRRLVIKEVNLMGIAWFLQRYRPRVVCLVRHPAAVALSYARLGWVERPIGKDIGRHQALSHRIALDWLQSYPDHRIIFYEELCTRPEAVFRRLYRFAGLVWDEKVELFVRRHTTLEDNDDPFGISRASGRMVRSWLGELSRQEIEDLKSGYLALDPPWYRAPEQWQESCKDSVCARSEHDV